MAFRSLLQEVAVKLSAELVAFCARIGHDFDRPDLLREALTHPSFATPQRPDNQRLEFLGDRVLGLAMSEALLAADPKASEGQLAPRFNALVRKEALAEVAQTIDLGVVLKLGRSEMLSGGRRKDAILADALEAVIAAVYLDAGFNAARALVRRLWGPRIALVREDARDAKTMLQEWAQARGHPAPEYLELGRDGPPHAPVFTMEVRLPDGSAAQASAGAKRAAEQLAAKALLTQLDPSQ